MNWSAGVAGLVPSGVVTVMSTVPSVPAGGLTVVIWVSEFTVKSTSSVPNSTLVALVKSVPEIVTSLPPMSVPTLGLTLVTVGVAAARAAWPTTPCSATRPDAITMTATMARNSSFSLGGRPGFRLCPLLEFALVKRSATRWPRSTLSSCSFPPGGTLPGGADKAGQCGTAFTAFSRRFNRCRSGGPRRPPGPAQPRRYRRTVRASSPVSRPQDSGRADSRCSPCTTRCAHIA